MKDEKQPASGKSQTPELQMVTYTRPESLPAGLQSFASGPDEMKFHWFKHPFLVGFFPLVTPCPIEDLLTFRQNHSDRLLAKGNVSGHIFFYERAYRMDCLLDLMRAGAFDESPEDYWKLLAQVWIDAEHPEDNPIWEEVLDAPLPGRDKMTKGKDRARLEGMGEYITIYRGVHARDDDEALENGLSGFQWTLSPKTARFFAKRFLSEPNQGFVLETEVSPSHVIAFLTGRGEDEIVVSPDHIDETLIDINAI